MHASCCGSMCCYTPTIDHSGCTCQLNPVTARRLLLFIAVFLCSCLAHHSQYLVVLLTHNSHVVVMLLAYGSARRCHRCCYYCGFMVTAFLSFFASFAMLSCTMQVVKASDVLFLFGGAAAVRDTLKSVKDDLKGDQIIVPVTKDGDIDSFQVIKQFDTWYSSLELLKVGICPDSCTAWMLFLTPCSDGRMHLSIATRAYSSLC